MHLSEGVLPLSHALAWSAVALPIVVWSLRGEAAKPRSSSVLMAGVLSILFAVTLLPLPVPIVGATSHICLTPALALVVGVRRIIWPTFFVLLLQAVFFAHGGITTLGINTLTLGVLGPLLSVALWTVFRRCGADGALGIGFACGLGSLSVYLADAVVLSLALSDLTALGTTFGVVVLGFAPVQVPLAVLEAVVSVSMIRLLARRRVDILPNTLRSLQGTSLKSALVLFAVLSGCSYEGIDGAVFGATAEGAGRPPIASIVDLSQGQVGLAMSIVILFGFGFVAGRSWERLLGRDDALPR